LKFQKLFPKKEAALFVLARAYEATKKPEEAIALYNQLIASYPEKTEYINNRGVINFNNLKKYPEAKADFEAAIRLSPGNGSFFLNLSRCHYMMGDMSEARKYAVKGKELGAVIDPNYAQMIGID
jgi:tetratricopeptide (TPR) repeat protein